MTKVEYEPRHVVIKQSNDDPSMDTILCPVCKFNYNHLRTIDTEDSSDKYLASWWGRGNLLVMDMECEEGHDWQLCIGYHKGQMYMFTRDGQPTADLETSFITGGIPIVHSELPLFEPDECITCGSSEIFFRDNWWNCNICGQKWKVQKD